MKKLHIIILSILSSINFLLAQNKDDIEVEKNLFSKEAIGIYDDDLLSAEFHAQKRNQLRAMMPDSSLAIFFSNPIRNRSNDVDFQYHQDPNFYYLTGIREPNAVLLIYKNNIDVDGKLSNEVIFVQERNENKELWDGKRIGKHGAKEFFGLNLAFDNTSFAEFDINLSDLNHIFYIPAKAEQLGDYSPKGSLNALLKTFHQKIEEGHDKVDVQFLYKKLSEMREIKEQEELVFLQKAIDITNEAHLELMKNLKKDMKEYQAQAIVEYVFKMNGAEYPGFPSIIGSGENSCILHYTTNRKKIEKNNLVVVDIGAEYRGYTADITRTLPVNGKFSEDQLAIYNIVLNAQKAGFDACQPGNNFWATNIAARKVVEEGLLDLGIITKATDAKKYFMHGTSHYLGLDVHDVGTYKELKPNTVITVEPGIYIPEGADCDPRWWNIGVRIEDDVLITENGYKVLSDALPRLPDEIEKIMSEKK